MSLPLKVKVATASLLVLLGAESIVVSGGVVSTTHSSRAGVGSTLPAVSVARARSTCGPSARFIYGESQAPQPASSRLHSNVALSSLERSKLTTSDDGVGPLRISEVWGGVRSSTRTAIPPQVSPQPVVPG